MVRSGLVEAVRTLPPSYFAFVMATGIISVGLDGVGLAAASAVLMWVAVAGFVVLLALSLWRMVAFGREFVADLTSPRSAFGFFTFVAGVNVLAARFTDGGGVLLPLSMLAVAFLVWVVLGYAIPWNVLVARGHGHDVLRDANGSWFVWAVASQSIAVVASEIEPRAVAVSGILAIVAVLAWSIGVLMYGTVGVAIVIRALMHGVTAEELGPSYWITMGAGAITVLAGSRVVEMTATPMVTAGREVIAGASVLVWAFITWLIPALVVAGIWRHAVRRVPLRYEAELWSMIFPLGMYAVASMNLAPADRLPFVQAIGEGFIWVAVVAWLLVVAGMAVHVLARWRGGEVDQVRS